MDTSSSPLEKFLKMKNATDILLAREGFYNQDTHQESEVMYKILAIFD
ncbi:hypothetical protein M3629_11275 [Paenibacillus polysaccharolyticus]|nr:hypothetical protein [Paenibacillus polysaccharolyticus]